MNDMIKLPDGSVRERFIMDGDKQRELVLVVANNAHGCRLTYRDAMVEGDKEFTGKLPAAPAAPAAPAVNWEDMSKSDIIEELDRRGLAYNAKDKKEVLLALLK